MQLKQTGTQVEEPSKKGTRGAMNSYKILDVQREASDLLTRRNNDNFTLVFTMTDDTMGTSRTKTSVARRLFDFLDLWRKTCEQRTE